MKVFKNLEIVVPDNRRGEFLKAVEAGLPSGWRRDREAEARSPGLGAGSHTFFVCENQKKRLAALVALVSKDSSSLYVSNIVPRETGQLTYDQYNCILDDFGDTCISPIAKKMNIELRKSADSESIEDWITEDTAKKLLQFSALANKSTGTSHPCDKERWYDFIIAVVMDKETLDASKLMRWLIEEDGWSEDVAQEMAIEFEQEVGLLKHYMGK